MPKFAVAIGGKAFEHDTAYVANDCKAASLWLPPQIEPDSDAERGNRQRKARDNALERH